jgi:hypothetical protein
MVMTEKTLRACYQKDFNPKFVEKEFGFNYEIVVKWYDKFDQEELQDNHYFCERTC